MIKFLCLVEDRGCFKSIGIVVFLCLVENRGVYMLRKGKFITFEGIDGSGKSTLSNFLSESLSLKGIDNIQIEDTKGTELARKVRDVIMGEEKKTPIDSFVSAMLFMAARKDTYKNVIEPTLNVGKWVICDRFFDSTLAYQGFGNENQEFIDKFAELRKFSFEDSAPDLTFILNIPVEVSKSRIDIRGSFDAFDEKSLSYREKVRKGFLTIAASEKNRCMCINANKPLNIIKKLIVEKINSKYFNDMLFHQTIERGYER